MFTKLGSLLSVTCRHCCTQAVRTESRSMRQFDSNLLLFAPFLTVYVDSFPRVNERLVFYICFIVRVNVFTVKLLYHVICSGNYVGVHPFTKGAACTECSSGSGWCDNGFCNEGEIFFGENIPAFPFYHH